jgi:plastocyanin
MSYTNTFFRALALFLFVTTSVFSYAQSLVVTTEVCDNNGGSEVRMTGPWWSWDVNGGPLSVDNGDGTYTFTFDPAPADNMEYLLVVDGIQEDLVSAGTASSDWSCTPITDFWSYANRQWALGSGDVTNVYGQCGSCPTNTSNHITTVGFTFSPDTMTVNLGEVINFTLGSTHNAVEVDEATFLADGNTSNGGFNFGFGAVASFTPLNAQTYYYVCQPHVNAGMKGVIIVNNLNGCTDSAADNYDASATIDDGSCTYSFAIINFIVDMNNVDQPDADYDVVVVNGSWNGWNGFGVTLADDDLDGVFTGTLEIAPGTSFEYVAAVTGPADGYSGWGLQWGDGCGGANVLVTAGAAGTVTTTSLSAGCPGVLGCMDSNATNYNVLATVQAYDQYGNLSCVYASCDDIPEYGCIYVDGFGAFNADFNAALCVSYGGTPCEAPVVGVEGCLDANASNYDSTATTQAYDEYGNLLCIYASCADVPEYGCIYPNGFGAFNATFSAADCVTYGGTPCEEPVAAEVLTITTTVCDAASSVAMTGPWWGWDPAAGPVASDNGDGSWTFTFDPAPTDNMEYLLVVDGVQEDLVPTGTASGDWSCSPVTDYWSYANRLWTVGSGDVTNVYGTCGVCTVLGCMYPNADNYIRPFSLIGIVWYSLTLNGEEIYGAGMYLSMSIIIDAIVAAPNSNSLL